MTKTAKRKPQSRIMSAVHEGALDLHRLGFIDKRKKIPKRIASITAITL